MTTLALLEAVPQWIVVMLVPLANGKTDKIPVRYSDGIPYVDAHAPGNWTTYSRARAVAASFGPAFTVGFVLTANDPFWCLDIDGALEPSGQWSSLALSLCAALPDTVVEVSQSGTGLHIWGQGLVPPHGKKNDRLGIELYSERRFIALGQPGAVGDMSRPCDAIAGVAATYFPPKPTGTAAVPEEGPRSDWRGPADDDDLLRRALQSKSVAGAFGGKASFRDLWEANADALARNFPPNANSSDPYNRSSADAALAAHLAFWTGCDVARIERLMRQSALAREKWDTRDDYLVGRTITGACERQREVLHDKPAAVPAVLPAGTEVPTMTAVSGGTILNSADQQTLFAGCVYVRDVHRVLVPGGKLLRADQFRATFGGYCFVVSVDGSKTTRNAFEAFTESQTLRCPQADGTIFDPKKPYGTMVRDAGRVRVNTWWPVEVEHVKADVTLFLEHLRKLFPDDRDRTIMLSYMAACVQHQGTKFQWAPLVIGVEGNGKTLLSRCVAEAIGRRYVFWPKAKKIAAQFNSWLFGHTFFAVEDIYASEDADVIESLKPMITGGDGLEIEAKGIDQRTAEICGNFIFNSNHKNAIRKTRNDRRFAVFFCAQMDLDDLARDGMEDAYMSRIYHWLNHQRGYAAVSEYLWTYRIPDEFNPATTCQRAPLTTSTEAAIEQGLGQIEQQVMEAIEQDQIGFRGGWVSSVYLDRLLDDIGRGKFPLNRRRDLMKTLGYDWHPALDRGRVNNSVLPDASRPRLFVRQGSPGSLLHTPADVARAYTAAQTSK